jgi:RNA-directed DNA polymerase
MRVRLRMIGEALRRRMHDEVATTGRWLGCVVRGWFAYFAVPGSMRWLAAFRHWVVQIWLAVLRRRSQKHRMTWGRIAGIADRFLPRARILHPWPEARFAVTHPR